MPDSPKRVRVMSSNDPDPALSPSALETEIGRQREFMPNINGIEIWRDSDTSRERYQPFYSPLLAHLAQGGKQEVVFVDIPSSTGYATQSLTAMLEENGYRVRTIGGDIKQSIITTAKRRGNVDEGVVAAAQKLPFAAGVADIAVCHKLLDEINPEQQMMALREWSRVLKPDGVLYATIEMPDREGRHVQGSTYILTAATLKELLRHPVAFEGMERHPLRNTPINHVYQAITAEALEPHQVWNHPAYQARRR